MTWKFIYTYREQCKTGPPHNRSWNWSPFRPKHTWMRFSKFWNTFPKVSTLTAWISWRIAFGASSDRITLYISLPSHLASHHLNFLIYWIYFSFSSIIYIFEHKICTFSFKIFRLSSEAAETLPHSPSYDPAAVEGVIVLVYPRVSRHRFFLVSLCL